MKIVVKYLLAAAMALSMAAPARAATIIVGNTNFDPLGSKWGTIVYTPMNMTVTMRLGRNLLAGIDPSTGAPVNFLSYALDFVNPLHSGDFQLQALAGIIDNPVKLEQIKTLVAHADPQANSTNKAAAIQMAVWEILYEQGTTGYNVATGQFRVRGGDSGTARTLANQYLNNVEKFVWLPDRTQRFAGLATTLGNQAQLVRNAVIPEPATWAMLILGFAGLGVALRRQRQAATAA